MIESINSLNKILSGGSTSKTTQDTSTQGTGTDSSSSDSDTVSLSPEATVDFIRSQARALKLELPGIIAKALLKPLVDDSQTKQPLNALINGLENPIFSVLGNLPEGAVRDSLVKELREEIRIFKLNLDAFRDNPILAALQSDLEKAQPLNAILSAITARVDDLGNRLDLQA